MHEQVAVQNLLRRKLAELQTRNPAFSVRAFAARLGLQPSATNEILKGSRRVSRKMAERIAIRLTLDPSERAEFLGKFPVRTRRSGRLPENQSPVTAADRDVLKLNSDQFSMISDWIHFAILNLIKTADFQFDNAWIAKRLAVTENRVSGAIERLFRLELIRLAPDGKLERTYSRVNTTDDIANISIQKSHLADMDLARNSLLRDPVESRDFTSLTLAISPEHLPQAKEILRRAQDEVAALAGETPATEVYRLTTYLFPFTRPLKLEPAKKE